MLDYFAAAALQGMLHGLLSKPGASIVQKVRTYPAGTRKAREARQGRVDSNDFDEDVPNFLGHLPPFEPKPIPGFPSADDPDLDPRDCAHYAYIFAKAMLEDREKHGSEE